uniref:Uncharacterized protein n=1 Tax=Strongyloides stercoralis TaxID=6248 RepID=A0A0K0E2N9_STRER
MPNQFNTFGMAVEASKIKDHNQKIKKVLVLEWRQEEEISENEARKLINNFSSQKKVCHKHRNMITCSSKIENNEKSERPIAISPATSSVSSRSKKKARKIKSKSTKSCSKKSKSKSSKSKKVKLTNFNRPSSTKNVNIKEASTDIEVDNSTVVTRQKIKIPYKLYWKPTITESGKEGITFKIQVQDLEGKKMELDVSCPGFMPNKVRLNGVNLRKL